MNFDDEIERIFEYMSRQFINVDGLLDDPKSEPNSGQFYYGYIIAVGPNGKPIIKEYGNIKQDPLPTSMNREPLIDKIVSGGVLKLVIEMPGLEKNDIKVAFDKNKLKIKGERGRKRYCCITEVNENIDKNSGSATYTNGILELKFKLIKTGKPENKYINVD